MMILATSCTARSDDAPAIASVGEPTACQITLGESADSLAAYHLNLEREGFACDVDGQSTILFATTTSCDGADFAKLGVVRHISAEQATALGTSCAAGSQHSGGRYSTVVRLRDEASESDVGAFQRAVYQVALRAPLGLKFSSGFNATYCFEYDDAPRFRRTLDAVSPEIPGPILIQNLEGSHCEAILAGGSRS